jgi:hypothetical protein
MKKYLILPLLAIVLLVGCVTVQERESSALRDCLEAQTAYVNAWETYHKFWQALPESDPRKKEWVEKWHPKFLEAGRLLQIWAEEPDSYRKRMDYEVLFAIIEDWLIRKIAEG